MRRLTAILTCACVACAQDDSEFEIWEPVPFRKASPADVITDAVLEKQRSFALTEAWLIEAAQDVQRMKQFLQNRSRDIRCRQEIFRRAWADQEVAILHLLVFRLVQIQAVAESPGPQPLPPDDNADGDAQATQKVVEVVVCIDDLQAVAGDFPVHDILRISTLFTVSNLCRNDAAARKNPSVLLQKLAHFFSMEVFRQSSTLYMVILASNAFFNDLHGKLRSQNSSKQLVQRAEADLIEKYQRLLKGGPGDQQLSDLNVVVSTDRVCRRGLYGACEELPNDPGPYLHASGLLGYGQALQALTGGILQLLERSSENDKVDLNTLLRNYASLKGPAVRLVPDRQQVIFGSLTEVIPVDCGNWCSSTSPCCPISNNIEFLHEAFYGRYSVEDCTLIRTADAADALPVLWSGDGIAKWTYLLSLESLALSCQPIARLVVQNHRTNLLENLFEAFEATQAPGAIAPKPRKNVGHAAHSGEVGMTIG
eukprot:Skav231070  [mRNA]  locus=scaffold524:170296:171741:+ [translate_table: standard]